MVEAFLGIFLPSVVCMLPEQWNVLIIMTCTSYMIVDSYVNEKQCILFMQSSSIPQLRRVYSTVLYIVYRLFLVCYVMYWRMEADFNNIENIAI